jgi:hypothetical protein
VSDAWVYLLRCCDGSLYTGWTSDLDRRMARHHAGKASRYTASRLPVELALALPMEDQVCWAGDTKQVEHGCYVNGGERKWRLRISAVGRTRLELDQSDLGGADRREQTLNDFFELAQRVLR